MIHIVITAGGLGSRFKNSIFSSDPKPLISWNNKSMLSRVIDNFLDDNTYITIIKQKSVNFIYQHKNVSIIDIDYITDGPASTASLAQIDPSSPLIITNCDQIIKDWHPKDFYAVAQQYDGLIGCFFSYENHNSYVTINENLLVTKVKEKERISNIATNGLYYWKNGQLFLDSFNLMIQQKDKVNNEYYVAPTYNYLINKGYNIGIYMFNRHYPIGTPKQLEKFIDNDNQ